MKTLQIVRLNEVNFPDLIAFEQVLRTEEDFWNWKIGTEYQKAVLASFKDPAFADSFSFLAYDEGVVVGRLDGSLLCSHFDGKKKAYLDWICVRKTYRHQGVAQALLRQYIRELHLKGIEQLIAIIAHNEEALRFYHSIENAKIGDQALWLEIK
ncbi:MAG: GNAT family N-acetyltransferase [Anaerolineaceae bacterium]|nr:GNAT family N-acetyltransferase [Anaerolineaceae bacterium]